MKIEKTDTAQIYEDSISCPRSATAAKRKIRVLKPEAVGCNQTSTKIIDFNTDI